MTRRMLDCREVPSDSGCSLTLTGTEDEVLDAGAAHAVAVHGHTDGPELREALRAHLRTAPVAAGTGSFVQVLEFRTTEPERFDELVAGWVEAIGGERTAQWYVLGADRESPGTYVEVVGFPDHEAAMRNSDHPATVQFAAKLGDLCEGPPTFRDLDVVSAMTP
ncbi:DUF1059 domain-containing protein [Actinomycetospora lemnae]|uniref:DUF1059 domain-containing protein n=1 Tax=Actinomycetospora lemnae TaxID=3019891 RepID=A0ABT5SNF7_9PSEU|nr:DUF1059 domain-containing protein [Actinomycetospora sp. DW7H6]MDD7964377.1 DUF1059 domain-containing protein [Actinomycetospora sp. DW7H6]